MSIILHNRTLCILIMAGLILSINTSLLEGCSSQNIENRNSATVNTKNNDVTSITTSESFILPSSNIYCALIGEKQDILRCEIRSMLNPLPPQPDNCEFDWGVGFLLSQNEKPEILCVSDTIGGSDYILSYGSTWTNAGFECLSQTTGLTCKNSTGRGFFLSREKWNIF